MPTLLVSTLLGCQTTSSSVTDVSCIVFAPLKVSRTDTAETIEQVRGHNAVWYELCEEKP